MSPPDHRRIDVRWQAFTSSRACSRFGHARCRRARLELPSLGTHVDGSHGLRVRAAQRAPCLLVTCLSQQCTVSLLTLPCLAGVCSSLGTTFSSPSTFESISIGTAAVVAQRAVVFWLRMCEHSQVGGTCLVCAFCAEGHCWCCSTSGCGTVCA